MRKFLIIILFSTPALCFAQENILSLTKIKNNRETIVFEGDRVLMAVKIARHEVRRKPLSVYDLSKNELADSVIVFSKGKIKSITDSSIFILEKNSLFSSSLREVKLHKINTLRKLSLGKQVVRTVTTVGGALALGIAVFYSYVATNGEDEFLTGMFIAAGIGTVATRFGKTKIPKRYLNKYKISLGRQIADPPLRAR
jgi:hypothetical protein